MSQRGFSVVHETLGRLEVLGGWDRPLGYSFLVVMQDDDEDGLVYSNLNDPAGPDVPPYKAKAILEQHGITIPAGFLEGYERDRAQRPGNLDVRYWTYSGDGRPQFEVWFRREAFDACENSPYLEETHRLAYSWLEPLDSKLEAVVAEVQNRLANPRSQLVITPDRRSVRSGDVIRAHHADGTIELVELGKSME
jgi:hypothetical protein